MQHRKQSLFERLTGSMHYEDELPIASAATKTNPRASEGTSSWNEEASDAQLTVDLYQTPTEIIVQTMVAGVKPEDLDINIAREMVTIKGTRHKHAEIREEDFFSKELYWGSFSRSVLLPQEIEVEKAEAGLKNGMLTIRLPKVNKEKNQSLKVKLL